MDEVLDCFLLDGHLANLPEAAHPQLCLDQLSVPIYHADVNAIVGETSLSFAFLNVHTRAEGAKKHAEDSRHVDGRYSSHPLSSRTCWVEALPFIPSPKLYLLFQLDHLLAGVSRKRSIGGCVAKSVDNVVPYELLHLIAGEWSSYVYPPLIKWPWRRDGGQVLLRIPWDGTVSGPECIAAMTPHVFSVERSLLGVVRRTGAMVLERTSCIGFH
ncbi:hypothetical protein Tco_0257377 [Tanacetum coccineum]